MNRLFASTVFAIVSYLSLVGMAAAHSNIVSSAPAQNAEVAAPAAIEMTFNEEVNLAFSSLALIGPDGAEVPLDQVTGVESGKGMNAAVTSELVPGSYTVKWTLLSPDGHKLEGSYNFTVTP